MAILNLKENQLHDMAFDGATFLGNLALIRMVPRLGDQTSQAVGGAFLLLGETLLPYVFIYLPGRYLFLVEDYRSGGPGFRPSPPSCQSPGWWLLGDACSEVFMIYL